MNCLYNDNLNYEVDKIDINFNIVTKTGQYSLG